MIVIRRRVVNIRVWDLPLEKLCNKHLVASHFELHTIWSVIANKKKGYSQHPEVVRWFGKLKALKLRHEAIVREMTARDYNHNSPLPDTNDSDLQTQKWQSVAKQKQILKEKGCGCRV